MRLLGGNSNGSLSPTMPEDNIKGIAAKQLEVQKQIEENTDPENEPPPGKPLPATTTRQQDITTAGQRRINLIWEYSQAVIALLVVIANMIVGVYHGVSATSVEYPFILSSALFLVIGFYFSRTNHAAIGGIGQKPEGAYVGR